MKNIIFFLLITGFFVHGQDNKIEGDDVVILTQVIEYHDNGNIAQIGTQRDGVHHGLWEQYDVDGKITALGVYKDGKKEGDWLLWVNDKLVCVTYNKNSPSSTENLDVLVSSRKKVASIKD
jgi:antitoxin component YwqK of YwqJK toxin-antitoxin module|tara:strand:- start:449 stop:811 length:363 start_codon:yes stop_codon:yes gene_type:complete